MNKNNLLKRRCLENFFHLGALVFIVFLFYGFSSIHRVYAGEWCCEGIWTHCEQPIEAPDNPNHIVRCPEDSINGTPPSCFWSEDGCGLSDVNAPLPPQDPRPYVLICPVSTSLSIGESRNLELRYWRSLRTVPNCDTEKYLIRNEEARWNSSNNSIVSVSNEMAKGVVTANSTGTANIIAIYNTMRTSFPITVLPPEINLQASSTKVANGEKITLTWSIGEGAKNCVASGGWRGVKNPEGGTEEVTVNFTSGRPLKFFMLSCQGGSFDSVKILNASVISTRIAASLSDAQASEDCDEEGNCKVPKNLFSLPLPDNDSLRMSLFLFTLLGSLLILILLYMKGNKKKISKKE